MLNKIRADFSTRFSSVLVDALLSSYEEIKQNYFLGKYEPSELNGGKFTEACYRMLESETQRGSYTPIGTAISDIIGKLRNLEQLPTAGALESFRITIPRTLVVVYNIRNKRGVGHLGGDVNPNYADSTLLVTCCDWVMAELVRIYYSCTLDEAQGIVDTLVQRPLSLVYEITGVRRVLLPSLSHRNQVLLLLAHSHPIPIPEMDLIRSIEPSNPTVFRSTVLTALHRERFIEYSGNGKSGSCAISPTGLKVVEDNYEDWSKSNKESKWKVKTK